MLVLSFLTFALVPAIAQTATTPAISPWAGLEFLNGTWTAAAQGSAGASTSGTDAFRSELGGHVLARYSTKDAGCKGPASFDCEHADMLYVYEDAPGRPLKAIYFDNEGHVIHYDVTTPKPAAAIFLSEPGPGPRFRLEYELKGSVMNGKFQIQMPGQSDWKSYLEWSGPKI
jgi:hypothetical protein